MLEQLAFPASQLDQIVRLGQIRQLEPQQILGRPADLYKSCYSFIGSGSLRSYRICPDGTEGIIQFTKEKGWIITPPASPDEGSIPVITKALEETWLIQWTADDIEQLRIEIPLFSRFLWQLSNLQLSEAENRIYADISHDARGKYDCLLHSFPDVINRVPQYMIAAYLGVTRKTIGRIRNELAGRCRSAETRTFRIKPPIEHLIPQRNVLYTVR